MSDLWFPGTDRSRPAPNDGGSILGGPPKCLWHDTETNGLPSYSTGSFPNMTLDPRTGQTWQHIAADRAARALRNPAGGVQTNRWNVFQIEVIGWVNRVPFHPVMAEVAQWLREVRGTPLRCTVDWLPYDASFGNSRVRLSGSEWNSYSGHLGHMHAPENDHGDPGWPFPISQIIAGEETDMPLDTDDKQWLKTLAEDVARRTVFAVMTGGIGQWSDPSRPGWEWYTPDVQASALAKLRQAGIVPGTTSPDEAYDLLFARVRNIESDIGPMMEGIAALNTKVDAIVAALPDPAEPPPSP